MEREGVNGRKALQPTASGERVRAAERKAKRLWLKAMPVPARGRTAAFYLGSVLRQKKRGADDSRAERVSGKNPIIRSRSLRNSRQGAGGGHHMSKRKNERQNCGKGGKKVELPLIGQEKV